MDKLFIPQTLRIGFQKREDTYTKQLGYVIYYDAQGKIRKEKSWESWRDKKIKAQEHENVPTEGFVINRNGGGTRESYGWNARHEFVRVFDPRNFEFEISIANLLYILQESNSMKGKGLEGEFVYAWAGTTLCLLPVQSAEYQKCVQFTSLQSQKVSAKSLVVGRVYETKRQEKLIYVGKHPYYELQTVYNKDKNGYKDYRQSTTTLNSKPRHLFVEDKEDSKNKWSNRPVYIRPLAGLTSLAREVSTDEVANFAKIMELVQKNQHLSPPVRLKTTPPTFKREKTYYSDSLEVLKTDNSLCLPDPKNPDKYFGYQIQAQVDHQYIQNAKRKDTLKGYTVEAVRTYGMRGNVPYEEYINRSNGYGFGRREPKLYTEEEVMNMGLITLNVELKSGGLTPIERFLHSYY